MLPRECRFEKGSFASSVKKRFWWKAAYTVEASLVVSLCLLLMTGAILLALSQFQGIWHSQEVLAESLIQKKEAEAAEHFRLGMTLDGLVEQIRGR